MVNLSKLSIWITTFVEDKMMIIIILRLGIDFVLLPHREETGQGREQDKSTSYYWQGYPIEHWPTSTFYLHAGSGSCFMGQKQNISRKSRAQRRWGPPTKVHLFVMGKPQVSADMLPHDLSWDQYHKLGILSTSACFWNQKPEWMLVIKVF